MNTVSAADRVAEFAAGHALPAVVLGVVDDTGLTNVVEYGRADPSRDLPASRSTLFRIASITKTFTATAILQLRDAGALTLDDAVVDHVAEFGQVGGLPGASVRVTLRQLLQHSSGLQGEPPPIDLLAQPLHTAEQILQVLPSAKILTTPGTAFRYSNLGFRVLAEVIKRRTGTRWTEYATAHILAPLGMASSGADPHETQRCAVGHVPGLLEDWPGLAAPVDSLMAEGDGDLWSSLDDLARWVSAQLGAIAGNENGVLSATSMREMQSPTFVAEDPGEARGLGWNGLTRAHGHTVSHGGLLAGFNSQVCFSPPHRVGVIALTNSVPRGSIAELALAVLDDTIEQRPEPVPRADEIARVPEEWERLLGSYRDPDGGERISIEFRRGRLVCVHSATEPPYPLDPTADPLCFLGDLEEWRFVTGSDGRAIALNAHGYPLLKEGE